MNILSTVSIIIRILATVWGIRLVWRTRDWRLGFLPIMFALLTLEQLPTGNGRLESQMREVATLTVLVVGVFYFLFRQHLRLWSSRLLRLTLGLIILYQMVTLLTGESFLGPILSHSDLSFSLVLCLVVVLLERILDERRQAENRLRADALHDTLTGLPNRAFFMEKLRIAHQRAQRQPYSFAVLFVDLDRFKLLNDSLGHAAGDVFLVQTALRLKDSLRSRDLVARLGGDEFAILLDGVEGSKLAVEVADRILQLLAVPHALDKQEIFTSASIGITLSSFGYERPEDMVRDADTAMYHAKAAGQGRCEIFEPRMLHDSQDQLQLAGDLRRALERAELKLFYQPIYSVKSGNITGCEALLRWSHPEQGLICPAAFIPLAEETGQIVPLGEWVFRTACTQAQAWQQAGFSGLRLSINVSPRQLAQDQFIANFRQVLEETCVAPQSVQLELSERVLLPDSDLATRRIEELAALGVRIVIDDFGIGYSSPHYLRRLPIHAVNIDRSLVAALSKGEKGSLEMLRVLVALAKSLDLEVTAEGVESEEQLSFLRSIGCDQMQGFLFSQPLPSEAFTELMRLAVNAPVEQGLPRPFPLTQPITQAS